MALLLSCLTSRMCLHCYVGLQTECSFAGAWGGGHAPKAFYVSSYFWDRAVEAGERCFPSEHQTRVVTRSACSHIRPVHRHSSKTLSVGYVTVKLSNQLLTCRGALSEVNSEATSPVHLIR